MASPGRALEPEALTRKIRIDAALRVARWQIVPHSPGTPFNAYHCCAVTEFPTALSVFRPISILLPEFLHISLLGGQPLNKLVQETREVVGQSNLSLEHCRTLEVDIPPIEEQLEVVRRTNSMLLAVTRVEARYLNATSRTSSLIDSLLTSSFDGTRNGILLGGSMPPSARPQLLPQHKESEHHFTKELIHAR